MTASIQNVIPAEQLFKMLSFLKIRPIQQPAANDAINWTWTKPILFSIEATMEANCNFTKFD